MRLRLVVATEHIDVESGRLWAAGALGIEELAIDAAHVALVATFQGAPPQDAFPGAATLADAEAPVVRPFAAPSRVGPFLITPPWAHDEDGDTSSGAIALSIDPGGAFGHGAHATTRLMLTVLADLAVEGRAVADIGCGTGVVAVAAAVLGASPILAIDNEPAALAATRRNVAANGVSAGVEVIEGDAADFDRVVDIALVNVTIDVHERIGPAVARHTTEIVVVGGILGHQVERAIAAYPQLEARGRTAEGEWHAVELARAKSTH